MKSMRLRVLSVGLILLSSPALASGPFGFCAIVDKVIFEPGSDAPERMQIFGAFAQFEGDPGGPSGIMTPANRGYMYFELPADASDAQKDLLRREWNDLASVAGTGEAVAFGRYSLFDRSFQERMNEGVAYTSFTQFAVRPVDEPPARPEIYVSSGLGVVALGNGNLDDIVQVLIDAVEP